MEDLRPHINTPSLSTRMEDFNLPSQERIALLERLQKMIGDVEPIFWATCQVCDLKALEELIDCARINPKVVRIIARQCRAMVRYWSAHPPNATSQPSTPNKLISNKLTSSNLGSSPAASSPPSKRQKTSNSPSSPMTRDIQAKGLAKQRDSFHCVLTKNSGALDVAHIYPFHSISCKEETFGRRHDFWDLLGCFWPREKVTSWEAELFPGGINELGVDRVYNIITLDASAHRMWAAGLFALKPISKSDDNMTLKIQFFWQKTQNTQAAALSLLTSPLSTKDLDHYKDDNTEGSSKLFDATDQRIKSGQVFELQTDDPITKPLPSFQLLEMQWFLQRIAGMTGAALDLDWDDWDDWDEESDGEVSDIGLDDGEESS